MEEEVEEEEEDLREKIGRKSVRWSAASVALKIV